MLLETVGVLAVIAGRDREGDRYQRLEGGEGGSAREDLQEAVPIKCTALRLQNSWVFPGTAQMISAA